MVLTNVLVTKPTYKLFKESRGEDIIAAELLKRFACPYYMSTISSLWTLRNTTKLDRDVLFWSVEKSYPTFSNYFLGSRFMSVPL